MALWTFLLLLNPYHFAMLSEKLTVSYPGINVLITMIMCHVFVGKAIHIFQPFAGWVTTKDHRRTSRGGGKTSKTEVCFKIIFLLFCIYCMSFTLFRISLLNNYAINVQSIHSMKVSHRNWGTSLKILYKGCYGLCKNSLHWKQYSFHISWKSSQSISYHRCMYIWHGMRHFRIKHCMYMWPLKFVHSIIIT